ncbi:MAG: hypothetical protein IJK02_08955 [Clostridia bacterium]|nr:hypothetical protein [Clostridia bacterium]
METFYDLIPSQLNIYMLVKFSFHKQIVQIPASFAVDWDIDFELLNRALNIEIERNDSMRLRFKKVDGEIKQYFLPSYRMEHVRVLHFKTRQEQEDFFTADAKTPVRFLKDETYRIYFFTAADGKKGVYFNCSHLAVDALGMMVMFLDLVGVYRALAGQGEMPKPLYKYEDYIVSELKKAKDEKKLEKGKAFYQEYFAKGGEPFYAGVHGIELLNKERKKTGNPDLHVTKAAYAPYNSHSETLDIGIDKKTGERIFDFCRQNNVAPESLFTFAMRTYCSAINERTEDVFYNLMCSKRITYKDMQTGGCMAQTLQVRTIIPEAATFTDGLNEIFKVRTQLFRQLSFPFIYARGMLMKMYGHSATQGVAAFMFSWLPMPVDMMPDAKLDFETYNLGAYFNPLYAICYPDPLTGGIMMHYMYRDKIVTEADVRRLHDNMCRIILQGIEDPDCTVAALMDSVE